MSQPLPDHEKLSAYLDDELSAEERAQVEQRLATDPSYAATLNAFRDQQARLQALPKGTIDVRRQVMDAVGDSSSVLDGKPRSGWYSNRFALASLAALLLLGVFLFLPDRVAQDAVVQKSTVGKSDLVADEALGGLDDAEPADAAERLRNEVEGGEESDEAGASEEVLGGRDQSVEAYASPNVVAESDAAELPAVGDGIASGWARKPQLGQAETLSEEPLSGLRVGDLERQAVKRQSRSKIAPAGRNESAFLPPFASKPLPSAATTNGALSEPLLQRRRSGFGEEEQSDLATAQPESRANMNALMERAVKSDQPFDKFQWRSDRIWGVKANGELAGNRLTVARFIEALEDAGCDYRKAQPADGPTLLPELDLPKETGTDRLLKDRAGQGVDLIVTATPKQLIKLRNRVEQFACLEKFDDVLNDQEAGGAQQSTWDGSKLSREEGVDPPGDGRVYWFKVFPETEPSGTR